MSVPAFPDESGIIQVSGAISAPRDTKVLLMVESDAGKGNPISGLKWSDAGGWYKYLPSTGKLTNFEINIETDSNIHSNPRLWIQRWSGKGSIEIYLSQRNVFGFVGPRRSYRELTNVLPHIWNYLGSSISDPELLLTIEQSIPGSLFDILIADHEPKQSPHRTTTPVSRDSENVQLGSDLIDDVQNAHAEWEVFEAAVRPLEIENFDVFMARHLSANEKTISSSKVKANETGNALDKRPTQFEEPLLSWSSSEGENQPSATFDLKLQKVDSFSFIPVLKSPHALAERPTFSFPSDKSVAAVRIDYIAGQDVGDKNILLSFDLHDAVGEPIQDGRKIQAIYHSKDPEIGYFRYLPGATGSHLFDFAFDLEEEVFCTGFRIIPYRPQAANIILTAVAVKFHGNPAPHTYSKELIDRE